MSSLKDTLTDQVKVAMKARELEKVKVLRNVQAVIKQIEIDRQVTLDDNAVLEILQKQVKQRQESLAIFTANGREDLAQKEQFEIDIISTFLPQAMSEDEVAAAQVLGKFAKTHPEMKLVGAFSNDGQAIDAETITTLSELPSKDQLIGQIVETLLSPVHAITGGLTNEDLEFRTNATN